jgi:hypothetical protein
VSSGYHCAAGSCVQLFDSQSCGHDAQVSVVDSSTQLDAAPGPLHLKLGAADAALVVRKPNLSVAADWSLEVVRPSAMA